MTSDQFWKLVALVGGYPPTSELESFAPLEDALVSMGSAEIVRFEDHLADILYALDRRSFAELPTVDTGRSQSSDSFLYNRCAVVIAGEAAYGDVLGGTRSFQDFTHSHVSSSESILYVAQKAYEQISQGPWDHVSPHDYETGSNEEGWQRS